MADNPPASQGSPLPPLPSSGTTGRLKSPTTHLPNKKGGAGKIVVMLSSVAKPPPAVTQALPQVPPAAGSPAKDVPANTPPVVNIPPPLPPKKVTTASQQPPAPKLSTTTYVKLPPKTNVPRWTSLSGKAAEASPATNDATPTPKVAEVNRNEPKKSGAQHIPPIKLNTPSPDESSQGESIFPKPDQAEVRPKPEGWKSLEAGELNPPEGGVQSLEVFARSQRLLEKPEPVSAVPRAKDPAAPMVAPPLLPPARTETPISAAKAIQSLRPPPLTPSEPTQAVTPPAQPLHVAPPMLEKAPEVSAEKLPQPHLEARKEETGPDPLPAPGVHKVPALLKTETPSSVPTKPLLPPTPARGIGSWLKKTAPLILSSTAKVDMRAVAEPKPTLKPAVLPKRSLTQPEEGGEKLPPPLQAVKATEPAAPVEKADTLARETPASLESPVPPPFVAKAETASSLGVDSKKTELKSSPALPPPAIPVISKAKAPLPETRVERAKKRRRWELAFFWIILVPAVVGLLLIGSLYFGRDTRVEAQVIPPPGTALNNEVWIVTNFSSEVSGISEDLAAERTPLMQEIQERQDHVQRAQGDIASREERIRLINENIQASKDDIVSVVKKARDDTQQIWDGEGAAIDQEYQSRFDQLKQTIAARAKSLNLKYTPDDTFQSPEVWANAYRLALYEVPPGVDGVKEHQWLADQMKQWRDYLKTLDDRKEQLREKAAQIKLAPAPKISDLNAKIDDLQQRVDATSAEEVPLKAELQQAQTDLEQAQAAEAGLDDKYYKELDDRPEANITKRIPLAPNGRFTWIDDNPFSEGEKEHHYWLFSRATRADGRQYWALHEFNIRKNQTIQMIIEPTGFISTKAILRPNLTPEEQEQ